MTDFAATHPQTITARIYASTLADIFTETLQNSRRAAAARHVDLLPGNRNRRRHPPGRRDRRPALPAAGRPDRQPLGRRRRRGPAAPRLPRRRGLTFGVFTGRHRGYNDLDLNFFGLTRPAGLPTVETVHGATWSVRAMAADPDPRPAYADWRRAREAGIDLAPPPALLRPWRPAVADVDDWRGAEACRGRPGRPGHGLRSGAARGAGARTRRRTLAPVRSRSPPRRL